MGDNAAKMITKMHSVPEDIKKAVRHELQQAINNQLVFVCHKSNHPDDSHNYLVLGYNQQQDNYTVICYNAQVNGLYWGHYGLNFVAAMHVFADAIWTA